MGISLMFKYGKHLSQTKSDQGVANLLYSTFFNLIGDLNYCEYLRISKNKDWIGTRSFANGTALFLNARSMIS